MPLHLLIFLQSNSAVCMLISHTNKDETKMQIMKTQLTMPLYLQTQYAIPTRKKDTLCSRLPHTHHLLFWVVSHSHKH